MAEAPRVVPLDEAGVEEEAPGVTTRAVEADGVRWALVEYAPDAGRDEWCLVGHRGYVVDGQIEYELTGRGPLAVGEGQGFLLPAGLAHRGRNVGPVPARLLVIDEP